MAKMTVETAADHSKTIPPRRRGKVVQPILGLVAPEGKRITPSQRELVRRAGTYLSPGQQMTARRRANREIAEHEIRKAAPDMRVDRGLRRLDTSGLLSRLRGDGEA